MKPFIKHHSRKFSESEKSNQNSKPKIRMDIKAPKTTDSDSISNSDGVYQSTMRCNKELKYAYDMNNSAILDGPNETDWAYENYGFRSLPSRGNKRNQRPGIKFLINSETVSQTKIFFYRDHQKLPDLSQPSPVMNRKYNISHSTSSNSLNSNDDPEIVAALDQIASEMGLIEEPVIRQSNDPINYLMATRSFSERISTNKSIFDNNMDKPRSRSHLSYSKPIFPIEIEHKKKNISNDLANLTDSTAQTPNKKRSSISKILERFSPKALRRTKSIPLTKPNPPSTKLSFQNNFHKKDKLPVEQLVAAKTSEHALQSETKSNISDNINNTNLQYINDNSKRLLNSLKVDRIEHPEIRFRTISKQRAVENNIIHSSIGMDLQSPRIIDKCENQDNKTLNSDSQREYQRSLTTNARYVNISLCAFGYGPHQSVYKSPIEKTFVNVFPDIPNGDFTPDQSNDRHNSDKAIKQSISKNV